MNAKLKVDFMGEKAGTSFIKNRDAMFPYALGGAKFSEQDILNLAAIGWVDIGTQECLNVAIMETSVRLEIAYYGETYSALAASAMPQFRGYGFAGVHYLYTSLWAFKQDSGLSARAHEGAVLVHADWVVMNENNS